MHNFINNDKCKRTLGWTKEVKNPQAKSVREEAFSDHQRKQILLPVVLCTSLLNTNMRNDWWQMCPKGTEKIQPKEKNQSWMDGQEKRWIQCCGFKQLKTNICKSSHQVVCNINSGIPWVSGAWGPMLPFVPPSHLWPIIEYGGWGVPPVADCWPIAKPRKSNGETRSATGGLSTPGGPSRHPPRLVLRDMAPLSTPPHPVATLLNIN